MEFILPTWLFQSFPIAYFVILAVLTYAIITNKQHKGGKMFVMLLVLWFIPIVGPVIVGLATKRLKTQASVRRIFHWPTRKIGEGKVIVPHKKADLFRSAILS